MTKKKRLFSSVLFAMTIAACLSSGPVATVFADAAAIGCGTFKKQISGGVRCGLRIACVIVGSCVAEAALKAADPTYVFTGNADGTSCICVPGLVN